MAKTRREFTPEFKREAVALLEILCRQAVAIKSTLNDMTGCFETRLIET